MSIINESLPNISNDKLLKDDMKETEFNGNSTILRAYALIGEKERTANNTTDTTTVNHTNNNNSSVTNGSNSQEQEDEKEKEEERKENEEERKEKEKEKEKEKNEVEKETKKEKEYYKDKKRNDSLNCVTKKKEEENEDVKKRKESGKGKYKEKNTKKYKEKTKMKETNAESRTDTETGNNSTTTDSSSNNNNNKNNNTTTVSSSNNNNNADYIKLRKKLNSLDYEESLCVMCTPLVQSIFNDLIQAIHNFQKLSDKYDECRQKYRELKEEQERERKKNSGKKVIESNLFLSGDEKNMLVHDEYEKKIQKLSEELEKEKKWNEIYRRKNTKLQYSLNMLQNDKKLRENTNVNDNETKANVEKEKKEKKKEKDEKEYNLSSKESIIFSKDSIKSFDDFEIEKIRKNENWKPQTETSVHGSLVALAKELKYYKSLFTKQNEEIEMFRKEKKRLEEKEKQYENNEEEIYFLKKRLSEYEVEIRKLNELRMVSNIKGELMNSSSKCANYKEEETDEEADQMNCTITKSYQGNEKKSNLSTGGETKKTDSITDAASFNKIVKAKDNEILHLQNKVLLLETELQIKKDKVTKIKKKRKGKGKGKGRKIKTDTGEEDILFGTTEDEKEDEIDDIDDDDDDDDDDDSPHSLSLFRSSENNITTDEDKQSQLQKMKKQLNKKNEELADNEKKIDVLKKELNEIKKKSETFEKKYNEEKCESAILKEELKKLEKEIKVKESEFNLNKDTINSLKLESTEFNNMIACSNETKKQLTTYIQNLLEKLSEYNNKIDELKDHSILQKKKIEDLEKEIKKLKNDLVDSNNQIDEFAEVLDKKDEQIEVLKLKIENLNSECGAITVKYNELLKENNKLQITHSSYNTNASLIIQQLQQETQMLTITNDHLKKIEEDYKIVLQEKTIIEEAAIKIQAELKKSVEKIKHLEEYIQSLSVEVTNVKTQRDDALEAVTKLAIDKTQCENELLKYKNIMHELQKKLEVYDSNMKYVQHNVNEINIMHMKKEEEHNILKNEIKTLKEKLNEKTIQLELLQEKEKKFEHNFEAYSNFHMEAQKKYNSYEKVIENLRQEMNELLINNNDNIIIIERLKTELKTINEQQINNFNNFLKTRCSATDVKNVELQVNTNRGEDNEMNVSKEYTIPKKNKESADLRKEEGDSSIISQSKLGEDTQPKQKTEQTSEQKSEENQMKESKPKQELGSKPKLVLNGEPDEAAFDYYDDFTIFKNKKNYKAKINIEGNPTHGQEQEKKKETEVGANREEINEVEEAAKKKTTVSLSKKNLLKISDDDEGNESNNSIGNDKYSTYKSKDKYNNGNVISDIRNHAVFFSVDNTCDNKYLSDDDTNVNAMSENDNSKEIIDEKKINNSNDSSNIGNEEHGNSSHFIKELSLSSLKHVGISKDEHNKCMSSGNSSSFLDSNDISLLNSKKINELFGLSYTNIDKSQNQKYTLAGNHNRNSSFDLKQEKEKERERKKETGTETETETEDDSLLSSISNISALMNENNLHGDVIFRLQKGTKEYGHLKRETGKGGMYNRENSAFAFNKSFVNRDGKNKQIYSNNDCGDLSKENRNIDSDPDSYSIFDISHASELNKRDVSETKKRKNTSPLYERNTYENNVDPDSRKTKEINIQNNEDKKSIQKQETKKSISLTKQFPNNSKWKYESIKKKNEYEQKGSTCFDRSITNSVDPSFAKDMKNKKSFNFISQTSYDANSNTSSLLLDSLSSDFDHHFSIDQRNESVIKKSYDDKHKLNGTINISTTNNKKFNENKNRSNNRVGETYNDPNFTVKRRFDESEYELLSSSNDMLLNKRDRKESVVNASGTKLGEKKSLISEKENNRNTNKYTENRENTIETEGTKQGTNENVKKGETSMNKSKLKKDLYEKYRSALKDLKNEEIVASVNTTNYKTMNSTNDLFQTNEKCPSSMLSSSKTLYRDSLFSNLTKFKCNDDIDEYRYDPLTIVKPFQDSRKDSN